MKTTPATCTAQKRQKCFCLFPILGIATVCTVVAIYRYTVNDLDFVFSSPMTEDDLRSLDLTLGTLLGELNRRNVAYFMISGTLLGSYRHHGRIPWDDDVDLMLNSSDKRRIHEALKALEPDYGLYLSHDFDVPYNWKFFPRRHGRPVSRRTYHWPFVDLFFFRENDTHVWNPSDNHPNLCWPRSVVFPLRQRPFDRHWLPAPCNVPRTLKVEFDISVCASRRYSHAYELTIPWWSVAVRCSSLYDRFPMVFRQPNAAGTGSHQFVAETLVLGNRTLHTITLENGC